MRSWPGRAREDNRERLYNPARPASSPRPTLRTSHFPDPPTISVEHLFRSALDKRGARSEYGHSTDQRPVPPRSRLWFAGVEVGEQGVSLLFRLTCCWQSAFLDARTTEPSVEHPVLQRVRPPAGAAVPAAEVAV